MICTVAPEAYQKGPETPYRYATLEDWRRVAAQVQDETTAEATRPDFTVRPAVLNISDVCNSWLYLFNTHVMSTWSHVLAIAVQKLSRRTHHSKGENSPESQDDAISPGHTQRRRDSHLGLLLRDCFAVQIVRNQVVTLYVLCGCM